MLEGFGGVILFVSHDRYFVSRFATRVLEMSGIDPTVYSGFAFGVGLERLVMRRFQISDMRLLYENDTRFLSQF